MKLNETFDTVSKEYDQVRLHYPIKMYRTILKYQPISKHDPLLEIGIGTGQGTEYFAKRNNPITAIDPGKALLTIAKDNLKKYSKIKYLNTSFEKARIKKNHFALVYSSQAFHWVNPKVGVQKVYEALRGDGALAFFWNLHSTEKPGPGRDTKKLYRKYKMIPKDRHTADGVINDIKQSGLYENIEYVEIKWTLRYSKTDRLNLLLTYSSIINLPTKQKEGFIQDTIKSLKKYSSPLRIRMTTKLILARKKK